MSSEEALSNVERLFKRIEEARQRIDKTDDVEQAIEILRELADLAREIETELARARRDAEAEAGAAPDTSPAGPAA